MKSNGRFSILLFCISIFLLTSCSAKRNLTRGQQNHSTHQKEQLTQKSVETDSLQRPGDKVVMPPAVDVSNYEPEYIRREKKKKAKAKEAKELVLRDDMVQFSKKYVGVPYKYAGKKPSTGFDCSGFTCYVYREFGMKLSAASRYQAGDGKKIAIKKSQPADLIIFGKDGKVNHVGIVVENSSKGLFVIHSTNRGVVIDNILESSYWRPRVLYARRVIGE